MRARSATLPSVSKALLAALLGAAAATLIACGSSGSGLIPAAQAGPLQSDIEAVEKAAEEGQGNCTATEAALLKTDQDYAVLPLSVNNTLRGKLRLGIENLHKVAREACAQPLGGATTETTTKAPPTTTTTTTAPPTTTSTTTTTPPPAENEESEHGPAGGTPAPGGEKAPSESEGAAPEEGEGGNGSGGAKGE